MFPNLKGGFVDPVKKEMTQKPIPQCETSNPVEKVFFNDFLLRDHIFAHLHNQHDIARVKRTCHRFKNVCDNFESRMKTLSIMKIEKRNERLFEVKFEKSVWILNLVEQRMNRTFFEKVISLLPKSELPSIEKVVLSGVMSGFEDIHKSENMIDIDADLGSFLDEFSGLKLLKFIRIDFENCGFEEDRAGFGFSKFEFIRRVTTLVVLDCGIERRILWVIIHGLPVIVRDFANHERRKKTDILFNIFAKLCPLKKTVRKENKKVAFFSSLLVYHIKSVNCSKIYFTETQSLVGPNIRRLHLTESMLRDGGVAELKAKSEKMINVTIYLDDINWRTFVPVDIQNLVISSFSTLPWHRMFAKEINLRGDKFIPIKHCTDLKYLKINKLEIEGNEDLISRTILELTQLPKLEEISIDGFYNINEVQLIASVLENCDNVVVLELRKRELVRSENNWISLIEHLPKGLRCLKLDNIDNDEAIVALVNRFSDSLISLEINVRASVISDKSLRMIFNNFTALRYLRINDLDLTAANMFLLQYSRIPKIEFHTGIQLNILPLQRQLCSYFYSVKLTFIDNVIMGLVKINWCLEKQTNDFEVLP